MGQLARKQTYKKLHNSDTAVFRVHDDVLRAMDRSCTVVLLLLDLSAAFVTVDHGLLLHRLNTRFGIKGKFKVLAWFKSYFTDRSHIDMNFRFYADDCQVYFSFS